MQIQFIKTELRRHQLISFLYIKFRQLIDSLSILLRVVATLAVSLWHATAPGQLEMPLAGCDTENARIVANSSRAQTERE